MLFVLSQVRILLENLNYWNVDHQEPYYSYKEASLKKKKIKFNIYLFFHLSCDHIH